MNELFIISSIHTDFDFCNIITAVTLFTRGHYTTLLRYFAICILNFADSVTCREMSRLMFYELRCRFFADFPGIRTSRMESASGRRIYRTRNISFKDYPLTHPADFRIGYGNSRQQRPCIRMQRIVI